MARRSSPSAILDVLLAAWLVIVTVAFALQFAHVAGRVWEALRRLLLHG